MVNIVVQNLAWNVCTVNFLFIFFYFFSVVQNLAWNVFTVDLSVAVVVVECDQTQELHRGNLEQRFGVSAQVLSFFCFQLFLFPPLGFLSSSNASESAHRFCLFFSIIFFHPIISIFPPLFFLT
jgi:hypothetical protein